ncbi:MAG: pyridoxamine 5'-phosphate oxidase family protein [Elusimicrobiota bacterium]|jgi:hypothetical protein
MDLGSYFDATEGLGVLSTADRQGKVDAALYARPHFLDDKNVLFIMSDRLSHKNLQSNPNAAYLFVEKGDGYNGKRLILKKVAEEESSPSIEALRRRVTCPAEKEKRTSKSFAVKFRILQVRPLVG